MAKNSTTKRVDRLEQIAIGAGFLLKKLQHTYGRDFGEGMRILVRDCIRDCDQVATSRAQREASIAANGGPKA